jgi:SAM-dependent methyltransferase
MPPADHARCAYEVFADFYDDFTRDHETADWTRVLEGLATDAGLLGNRLLDVACGTGESFLAMLERGFDVTACDISSAMIVEARRKAGSRVQLSEQDLRDLPVLGSFDLVWCLGDALNYLHSDAELEVAFRGMRSNLAPEGIVVFDINTLGTFRSVYSSLRVMPGERHVIVLDGRSSSALEAGGAAEVWIDRLSALDDGDTWTRVRSVHHHRHHSMEAIGAALERAGLETVARYGSTLDGLEPGVDERRHIKAVFVARHVRA